MEWSIGSVGIFQLLVEFHVKFFFLFKNNLIAIVYN